MNLKEVLGVNDMKKNKTTKKEKVERQIRKEMEKIRNELLLTNGM